MVSSSSSSSSSLFEGCTEQCGYLAALTAIFAWGSFAVPLKFAKVSASTTATATTATAPSTTATATTTTATTTPEVNFFVLQSYKTVMLFLTCWLVLIMGERFQFSLWGIVSGLFWVPGASCGIYGIRNAGLAIAVGTWSSIQVLTSFIFGIVIFEEQVKNIPRASMAFILLILGLVGMARYAGMSSPPPSFSSSKTIDAETEPLLENASAVVDIPTVSIIAGPPSIGVVRKTISNATVAPVVDTTTMTPPPPPPPPMEIEDRRTMLATTTQKASVSNVFDDEDLVLHSGVNNKDDHKKWCKQDLVVFCGGRFALTKRQLGILGAIVNGAWGGCSLIPLHYARRDSGLSGAAYLISYAIGSMIVNTVMWILLFLYYYVTLPLPSLSGKRQLQRHPCYMSLRFHHALSALPQWHLRQLWWPGFLSGSLHSIGNFCSILAVTYLGQATGFSMCQLQLFVSGLWAVFYFQEIKRPSIILKWFLSAALAISGIIWLSWEHQGAGPGGGH